MPPERVCDWCGLSKPTDQIEKIWDQDVCQQCQTAMANTLMSQSSLINASTPEYLKKIVRAEWFVRCTHCGNPGPGGPTAREAIENAIQEGWSVHTHDHPDGGECMCPECIRSQPEVAGS